MLLGVGEERLVVRDVANKLYPEEFNPGGKAKAVSLRTRGWKKWMLYFLVLILFIIITMHIYYYNKFTRLLFDVSASDANIASLLQMRRNICINLTTAVLDYAKHEREIFRHVTEMRARLVTGVDLEEGIPKEKELKDLERVLSKILAIAEQYPDLKLSQNFQHLMKALVNSETGIAEKRIDYNNSANVYTTAINQFPGSVFARLWGFESRPFFIAEKDATTFRKIDY